MSEVEVPPAAGLQFRACVAASVDLGHHAGGRPSGVPEVQLGQTLSPRIAAATAPGISGRKTLSTDSSPAPAVAVVRRPRPRPADRNRHRDAAT
jgi:hypothetical protein